MKLPSPLILATGNPGKRRELADLLARHGVTVLTPDLPSPAEDGASYEENAAIKAVAASAAGAALGDDVGLEVDALDGAPGLETRRWAEALGGWDAARAYLTRYAGSGATYRCALAVATPDGRVWTALGSVRGRIVGPVGPGVGLEPCFVPDGADRALSELGPDARDRLHHRHRALRALLAR